MDRQSLDRWLTTEPDDLTDEEIEAAQDAEDAHWESVYERGRDQMATMSDEDRLIDEFADVMSTRRNGRHLHHLEEAARINLLLEARGFVEHLRTRGVTLTPPPAPEPTYTITFTQEEIRWLEHFIGCLPAKSIIGAATAKGIYDKIDDATPDPEPTR